MKNRQESGIKNWPPDERPREKLIGRGHESLSDGELLAIILRTGKRSESALELARGLLNRFDGLRGLINISI
ncbi:MAG: UPF0758 domain-containing protein, partial [Nitrospirota bacterium]